MNRRLILGTRKGLLIFVENGRGWELEHEAFPGVPINYAMRDHRSGTIWVAADHGHWGQKLYRSDDDGATLTEAAAPKYPEGATRWNVWASPPVEEPSAGVRVPWFTASSPPMGNANQIFFDSLVKREN